jgi:hypothetical protein
MFSALKIDHSLLKQARASHDAAPGAYTLTRFAIDNAAACWDCHETKPLCFVDTERPGSLICRDCYDIWKEEQEQDHD